MLLAEAFKEAMFIANDILTSPDYSSMISYALFYHAEYVQPYWAKDYVLIDQIGEHMFYSP